MKTCIYQELKSVGWGDFPPVNSVADANLPDARMSKDSNKRAAKRRQIWSKKSSVCKRYETIKKTLLFQSSVSVQLEHSTRVFYNQKINKHTKIAAHSIIGQIHTVPM